MENEKPRLARLTAISTQLQSRSMITARELADRHQVSIRTIYRDIQTLIQSGIPIVTEEGKGYSLMADFRLSPVAFTEEEANAIITAEHILRHNTDYSFTRAFESAATKIRAILHSGQKQKADILANRIQVRNTGNSENPVQPSSENLSLIQKAITNYSVLDLHYQSLNGELSQRCIEPFALYSTQGNWILIAHCRTKRDWRSFRLDCIRSVCANEQYFEPHSLSLEEYFEECRKKFSPTPDIPLAQDGFTLAANPKSTI
ncbi:MAG: YafY family protein [Owenweeksia sp.]